MKHILSDSSSRFLFSGGMAEIVPDPTPLTYSFFRHWFTGTRSIGSAMTLLGLPYTAVETSPLVLSGGRLAVDLILEEQTLYGNTFFSYRPQESIDDTPRLTLSPKKLFAPACWIGTLRILLRQSLWLANPDECVKMTRRWIDAIPPSPADSIPEIEEILIHTVWPAVIATGALAEFFSTVHHDDTGSRTMKSDWFFRSVSDMETVRSGAMTFDAYMNAYGLRADKDYELTCPRWHEIPGTIRERINRYKALKHSDEPKKNDAGAGHQLQKARTEAKKKALVHINKLRILLRKKVPDDARLSEMKRDDILAGKLPITERKSIKKTHHAGHSVPASDSGEGTQISGGNARGTVKHVTDNETDIPAGTIGIFPNASPEFAPQFPHCSGMIFLTGAMTSHGAIVAREFGIPAIRDPAAESIADGTPLIINGTTGEWSTEK